MNPELHYTEPDFNSIAMLTVEHRLNEFVSEGEAPATFLSAPAGCASDESPATNRPETANSGVAQAEATGQGSVPVRVSNPAPATTSNPHASSSRQADKADAPTSSPDASAAPINPLCKEPRTCGFAHKPYSCWQCNQAHERAKAERRGA